MKFNYKPITDKTRWQIIQAYRFWFMFVIGMVLLATFLAYTGIGKDDTLEIEVKKPALIQLVGEFSAYNALPNQTDERYWEMASGKEVYEGAIACPPRFKFGDEVLIGDKWFVCEDRMNKRYRESDTNHFDIYMEDYDEALSFGRKELAVYILNK